MKLILFFFAFLATVCAKQATMASLQKSLLDARHAITGECSDLRKRTDSFEAKAANAEAKAAAADAKATNAETKATTAEAKATNAETKATTAETRAATAEATVKILNFTLSRLMEVRFC